ncbi:hypothetical protein CBR_g29667 [Chara braunii]|uniref:HAT C-terminal dimerisation domain-containing protein n=1 Tax=Chara braunii TaxID=69332 RepID=A0A388LB26_CHABU|nr:hypothetical protein CBR_g29667 [Chara braunii]|eukprot:GBG79520.1 hypothetical protein CBR_g29667 [Chara braunii]
MMRQPAHALAYLVDPRRHDVSLLADTDCALVQSALHHLATYADGGEGSQEHTTMWYGLYLFHHDDPHADPRPKWWTDPVAIAQAKHGVHPAWWWYLHGADFPWLQEVAIKVLSMWSIASPSERNWATHDLIHTKRRNGLSSDSLRKLMFIHWNMQFLRARLTSRKGYVDVWEDLVEEPSEPVVGDPSEEVYAEGMTIPEEVEADLRRRCKEGGDRVSARLLQARDDDDVEAEDAIYEVDDMWEGNDMIEEITATGKGKEKMHDDPLVSRVWDRWGSLDAVEDLDGFLHGSRHTLHIMKDIEECRRPKGGSERVDEGHHVDTGFHSTAFDGEAGCSAATTDVGATHTPQMSVTPLSTLLFGMPLDDGAGGRPSEGPILRSVAEEQHLDVGELKASRDSEDLCPDVEEQEAAAMEATPDMEKQEATAMSHGQPCLSQEEMGTGHTEHASPAPSISEVAPVIGEGVRGCEPDQPCNMETGTDTTAPHPQSTAGRDVMDQLGSEAETEREMQTSVQPPPTVQHVAPSLVEPPRTFESIESQRASTTMIGGSPAAAMSSATLRPTSFYTAPPLPVLKHSVVVWGPGLTIPLHSSSREEATIVGRLSSSTTSVTARSHDGSGDSSMPRLPCDHSQPLRRGSVDLSALPPLPARVLSVIVDNTATRGKKRKIADTCAVEHSRAQRPPGRGRPHERPPGGRSGRGRGRLGVAGATERLLGSLGAIGGGSPSPISADGVRTRSRGVVGKRTRVHVEDDEGTDEQVSGDGSESEYEAPPQPSCDDDDDDNGGDDDDDAVEDETLVDGC